MKHRVKYKTVQVPSFWDALLSAGDEANLGRHTAHYRQDASLRGASAVPWPSLEEREN